MTSQYSVPDCEEDEDNAVMYSASSPIEYPTTSSPNRDDSPRKRRKIDSNAAREPLQTITNNSNTAPLRPNLAGFVDGDDSDDDDTSVNPPLEGTSPITEADDQLPPPDDFNDVDSILQSKSLDQTEPTETTQPAHHPRHLFPNFTNGKTASARTCSGRKLTIKQRQRTQDVFYGDIIASKSKTETRRAQKNYYGIDIHALIDQGNAAIEAAADRPDPEPPLHVAPTTEQGLSGKGSQKLHLWTEKYRARKFTDLLGDERTHRSVLRWFKAWDSVVFPHAGKPKAKSVDAADGMQNDRQLRKILLLTGPPGLGKTTLAHICARQAGYETKEINASDDRSKDVVNGRIRDMVGTENVRSLDTKDTKKAARPLCIVVDEVDGVVGGNASSGGEGGFIKALIDLVALDQRNSTGSQDMGGMVRRKKKGDKFRLLRPLVLVCNDVYHPSLRPLRQSSIAEVIHVRRPPLNMVIPRMSSIFAREGIPADNDGVRTLCEAVWGVTSRKKGGSGTAGGGGVTEGDIRTVLVTGEWVASKIRCASLESSEEIGRLTRKWVEQHVLGDLAHNGSAARSLGRGGGKEVVARVFAHNAGFPLSAAASKSAVTVDRLGSAGGTDLARKATFDRLREMAQASGESDRIVQDVFSGWPLQNFQDTTTLSKPCAASEWLHFSSLVSHKVHTGQEWELMGYTAYPILALHSLFAATSTRSAAGPAAPVEDTEESTAKTDPFNTPKPDLTALELHRAHTATLTDLHSTLTLPLRRLYPSPMSLAADLVPYALRILNPAASPTLIGGQASLRRAPERARVARATSAMAATGVRFEKTRIDAADGPDARAGSVLRMAPSLDEAGTFATLDDARTARAGGDAGRARFALRAILSQTFAAESARRDADARTRRGGTVSGPALEGQAEADDKPAAPANDAAAKPKAQKRDFFGRPIVAATAAGDAVARLPGEALGERGASRAKKEARGRSAVWITFHEGFSAAVRKPITMRELLDGL